MRVTDEMVERAVLAFCERTCEDSEEIPEVMLAVLSAALADVPEPVPKDITDRMRVIVGRISNELQTPEDAQNMLVAAAEAAFEKMRTDTRIAELEAQLAKVRRWADDRNLDEVRRILDGKEDT